MHTQQTDGLRFSIEKKSATFVHAVVTIPETLVDSIYRYIAHHKQHETRAFGFRKGHVPLGYVEHSLGATIIEHLKEFLFNYFALNFLQEQIHHHKLLVAGDPRLVAIHVAPQSSAQFVFELTLFPPLELQEWRYFPFKAPKRKKYKDLDRQVESFITEEKDNLKKYANQQIMSGDWVGFELTLMSHDNLPLVPHSKNFWLRIGDEEADLALRELFQGKWIGDSFCTDSTVLQDYFSTLLDARYIFCITITNVVQDRLFSFDEFKRHFKLKTNKEMVRKLIEVFSYRNDLSQRRAMVEDSLALLLSKHPFTIPPYLVLRQEKQVLDRVKYNPDYHVYRMQRDFKEQVRQLAEKQAKEAILLDQIAHTENLAASKTDIECYLNLTKRHRMKEFIYFDVPATKLKGYESPLAEQEIKHFCLREKTLNHIINHLTNE